MSSRGARTKNGHVTTKEFRCIREVEGAKVLVGTGTQHGLPDYSHTPNRIYIKENHDGSLRELREYDKTGFPIIEIAYHAEPQLTGNRHEKILHYHTFEEDLSRNKAKRLTENLREKYYRYLRGIE
ncbi:hypothetical protein [Schwartzia succinivorans]|jgi:hypothetical protein|uniref:Uncharacterized protein n=1 Tax=Schwartzia succinivorans DSM 10502 TaxID=1123243 RepID=A0A1M4S7U5_9FIRM|nr:hypothetical protein [Schwartzia succinivorans]SHE28107.1 hypothetical protein SAMN02745190_00003 [Schwartzia succinivorans DSM 10502]